MEKVKLNKKIYFYENSMNANAIYDLKSATLWLHENISLKNG